MIAARLSVQFLPVGQYSISAQIAGFKKTTIDQVVLQVDQTASIRVTLQPGEVREVIEVKGAAASLDVETSSLGQVIENKKILELPLNGRNAFCPRSALGQHDTHVRHGLESSVSSRAAAASRPMRSRWTASTTTPCRTQGRSDGMASQ